MRKIECFVILDLKKKYAKAKFPTFYSEIFLERYGKDLEKSRKNQGIDCYCEEVATLLCKWEIFLPFFLTSSTHRSLTLLSTYSTAGRVNTSSKNRLSKLLLALHSVFLLLNMFQFTAAITRRWILAMNQKARASGRSSF